MNLINTKQKIYIAGHNGMVGKAIVRTLKIITMQIYYVQKEELDLTNTTQVANWFTKQT